MSIESKTSIDKIAEYGNIAEFSYLTLESKYFEQIVKK